MNRHFDVGLADSTIKKFSTYNTEFFFKNYENTTYINYGNSLFVYANNGKFAKGMFLFGLVKKDFDKWLRENPNPSFTENYRAVFINQNNSSKLIKKKYSVDIDHSFWRIAFLKGYISENTYKHGLRLKEQSDEMKQLYCMALSNQGQSIVLDGYIGSKKTGNTFVIDKNPLHKEIYRDIRNSCFKFMEDLLDIIGMDDFIEYNVDCISFKNASNKRKIESYLKNNKLFFKYV